MVLPWALRRRGLSPRSHMRVSDKFSGDETYLSLFPTSTGHGIPQNRAMQCHNRATSVNYVSNVCRPTVQLAVMSWPSARECFTNCPSLFIRIVGRFVVVWLWSFR